MCGASWSNLVPLLNAAVHRVDRDRPSEWDRSACLASVTAKGVDCRGVWVVDSRVGCRLSVVD